LVSPHKLGVITKIRCHHTNKVSPHKLGVTTQIRCHQTN